MEYKFRGDKGDTFNREHQGCATNCICSVGNVDAAVSTRGAAGSLCSRTVPKQRGSRRAAALRHHRLEVPFLSDL